MRAKGGGNTEILTQPRRGDYFFKAHRIGEDSGILFSLCSSNRSRVRIFVFVRFIGTEQNSDLCFGLSFRSGVNS